MNALINKAKERGMTLIISTHDLKLAKYYAEVIIELKEGKLYEYSKSSI
jgi:ABC-type phosphate/phosphonate transport system ATPase subunit